MNALSPALTETAPDAAPVSAPIPAPEARQGSGRETVLEDSHILASLTDKRGVIAYANPEFCQVAEYSLSDLTGAPHKIVRHPDTPRGLFHLFWARLKGGESVCAYVKNRTASGGFYWVLAVVMPYEGGYISVRIKPKSARFDKMRALYASVLAEEAGGLSPAESAEKLMAAMRAEGQGSFTRFMTDALVEEFTRRAAALGGEAPARLLALDALAPLLEEARRTAEGMRARFDTIRNEPVNMRILSSRLESGGAAISMISQNYDFMAHEMSRSIAHLCSGGPGSLDTILKGAQDGRLALLSASLMQELVARQTAVSADGNADGNAGGKTARTPPVAGGMSGGPEILRAKSAELDATVGATLGQITQTCNAIPGLGRGLRRRVNGLDVVKLLCRVEDGRSEHTDSGLTGIIDRLEAFHNVTDKNITDLTRISKQIAEKANSLM